MRLEKIIDLRSDLQILTGLHIGAGDLEMRIGGVDNSVIRNPRSNEPYIPGSSLKGKIRSLLEWRSGRVQQGPLNFRDLQAVAGQPQEQAVEAILRLFGVAGDVDDEALIMRIGPTRLSFHDATLIGEPRGSNLPITEVKSENSIDRIRGVAQPRQTERVVSGVRFAFRVAIKVLDSDPDLVKTLLVGLRLLEMDSLGGSGSRGYGKVKFENVAIDGKDVSAEFNAIDPFASERAA